MKLAFVIPWYGEMGGEAQNACKAVAENLSKEMEVHLITTCIKDFYSNWNKITTEFITFLKNLKR